MILYPIDSAFLFRRDWVGRSFIIQEKKKNKFHAPEYVLVKLCSTHPAQHDSNDCVIFKAGTYMKYYVVMVS